MNALIVLSLVAASSAQQIINPYGLNLAAGIATPYGIPTGIATPYGIPAGPIAAPLAASLAAPTSQYQAQDELGNINYGYANPNSAKQEVGNALGGVTGAYSYVDAYGIPQRVEYIADALGFRVKATNLPVAPKSIAVAPVFDLEAPVFDLESPEPVQDTEEVMLAKAEFKKAFDEAAAREKREAVETIAPITAINAVPYGLGLNALPYGLGINNLGLNTLGLNTLGLASPLRYAAPLATAPIAVSSPLSYSSEIVSAPAARQATLTKTIVIPGQAYTYRVD